MVTKVTEGLIADEAVLLAHLLTAVRERLFDPGDMKITGAAAAPSGWLLCDGAAVSRSTYSALFDAIGTTFGAGDGSTTFNVPNFKGRSPLGVGQGNTAEGGGAGTNRALADTGGAETHLLTTDQLPAHTHSMAHTHAVSVNNSISAGGNTRALGTTAAETGTFNTAASSAANTGGSGSDVAHNNMAPFLAVNFIIKT